MIGFKLDIFDIYDETGYWLNEDEFILYDWVNDILENGTYEEKVRLKIDYGVEEL
mgnify:FL=1|jgi:hypothetical protein|tara:strand:+ start:551 stop:715 length:165 start_codon:yes stop_codon:yes gene_type:complete